MSHQSSSIFTIPLFPLHSTLFPLSPFLFRFVLLCFFVSANPICSASLYCTVLCCVALTLLYCTALREGRGGTSVFLLYYDIKDNHLIVHIIP